MKKRIIISIFLITILLVSSITGGFGGWFKDLFNIGEDSRLKGELASLGLGDEGLIAYYPFDENADDISGNDNHGVVHGANQTTGKFGNAYSFDGEDDYIEIESNALLNSEVMTLMAWVYVNSLDEEATLVNKHNSYRIGINKAHQGFMSAWVNIFLPDYTFFKAGNIPLGSWHHMAITLNAEEVRAYIDGDYEDDFQFSGNSANRNDQPFQIGYTQSKGLYAFDGKIDEVKILNYVLTEAEIKASYNCVDECSSSGEEVCEGNGVKTCGNYDSDSCLEWEVVDCLSEQICNGGRCFNDIPVCTENDWSSLISPVSCPSSGQQTKTWTKTGNCEGGVSHETSEIIPCDGSCVYTYSGWSACNENNIKSKTVISQTPQGCQGTPELTESCSLPPCIVNNWKKITSLEGCPSSGQQIINWTKVGVCQGGIIKSASETIACNYSAVICTNWNYTNFTECLSSNIKIRNVTSSSPEECEGGNPLTSINCDFCELDCANKECGDDGCGGSCGDCSDEKSCVEGLCLEEVGSDVETSDSKQDLDEVDNEVPSTEAKMSKNKKTIFIVFLVIILLVIAIILFYFFRKKKDVNQANNLPLNNHQIQRPSYPQRPRMSGQHRRLRKRRPLKS